MYVAFGVSARVTLSFGLTNNGNGESISLCSMIKLSSAASAACVVFATGLIIDLWFLPYNTANRNVGLCVVW